MVDEEPSESVRRTVEVTVDELSERCPLHMFTQDSGFVLKTSSGFAASDDTPLHKSI